MSQRNQPAYQPNDLDGTSRERRGSSTYPSLHTILNFIFLTRIARNLDRGGPQSAQHLSSHGHSGSGFSDGSGPIFKMYVDMAEKEDNKMAERWQKDADGILIFVSDHISLHCVECSEQCEHSRLVYSLLPLRHWSQCPSRI
jgi:hypothetical protein